MSKPKQRPIANQAGKRPAAATAKSTSGIPNSAPKGGFDMMAWLPLVATLLVTLVLFWPATGYDFVNWDDEVNIHNNKSLKIPFGWECIKSIFTSNVIGGYNPLPILTFAIEKAIWGPEVNESLAHVMHTNNILLHLVAVYFVFACTRELGLKTWPAAVVALLFGMHPMRVESVAWVTERKDVLLGIFFFWSLLHYIKYAKAEAANAIAASAPVSGHKKHFYISLLLLAIALISKIQAVSLPLAMLCVDYYLKRPIKFSLVLEKIPHFAMAFAIGLLGVLILRNENTIGDVEADIFSFGERLLIGASGYSVYLIKSVFPYIMSPLYPYPSKMEWYHYASPVGVALALAAFIWAFRNEKRTLAFAIAFFTVNVMFVLQIVGAGQGYWADRFTYIGYFGLFFALGAFLQQYTNSSYSTALWGGTTVFILVMSLLTYRQVPVWKDGVSLWTKAMEFETKTALPWTNRGQWYRNHKQYDLAVKDYEQALKLKPKGSTYNSLAKLYFDQQKPVEALKYYNEGIAKDTTIAEMYVNRGAAYAMLGQQLGQQGNRVAMDSLYRLAINSLEYGIRRDTAATNGYLNLGLVYYMTGQYDKSFETHNKHTKLSPFDGKIWYEAGNALITGGRTQESMTYFNKAIEIEPGLKEAYYQRARAQNLLGKKAEARADLQKSIALGMKVSPEVSAQINQ